MPSFKTGKTYRFKDYSKVVTTGIILSIAILVLMVAGWDSLQDSARIIFHQSISNRLEKEIDAKFFQMYPEYTEKLAKNKEIILLAQGDTAPDNPEVMIILQTAKQISGASIVYVMDRNGTVIGCSPYGTDESLTGDNYSFRPYFIQAMQGKTAAYPALGVTTDRRGIYFSTPIYSDTGSEPIGAVVIKALLDPIDDLLDQITEPVALLSPDGIVFAANRYDWMYHAALPIEEKTLAGIRKSRQFSDQAIPPLQSQLNGDTIKLDGINYTVRRIPIMIKGWQIGTLASLKVHYAVPIQQLLVFWGGLCILVILSVSTVVLLNSISRRRIVEKELRRTEERYRSIFENAVEGIIQTTLEGRFLNANPTLAAILGYSTPAELMAEITDIPRQVFVDSDRWDELIRRLKKDKAVSGFDTEFYRKDKSIVTVSINARIVEEVDGTTSIDGFLNDITKRKQLETQLKQAQKMEAIGTLAGGIAHDFNNVLQAIFGYVELLMQKKEIDDTYYTYLNNTSLLIHRSTRLISQLLTTSRKLESRPEQLNFNDCVVQACELLRNTIPKMIEIETNLSVNPVITKADPVQMEQIILNLATNARDAMPGGGRLMFETKVVFLDDDFCRHHPDITSGNYVNLSVTDTGQGMEEWVVEHIFEPFFSTKNKGKGTGLGLATVYGIIKNHDGYISCSSTQGHGTTFSIYLPALMTTETSEVPLPVETVEPKGGHETILLVDDEVAILDIGKEALEEVGYKVVTTKTGEEAVEYYEKKNGASADLVLLDLDMPGMGGCQCFKKLLKLDASVKVVITSGYLERAQIEKAMTLGAADFIAKPYTLAKLIGKVREVLDR